MPFVNSTKTILEDEAKELEEMVRNNPEAKAALERFETECEFRRKLVEARKNSGFTQVQLQEVTGLRQQAISRIEKTDSENSPSLNTIFKYLDALGYKLDIVQK